MGRAAGGEWFFGAAFSWVDLLLAVRIMGRAVGWCPGLVKWGEGVEGLGAV